MSDILKHLRAELKDNIDEKTIATGQNFFKEEIQAYGIKISTVSKLSKSIFKELKTKSKAEIFLICEELWQSGWLEEAIVACNWSYSLHKQYTEEDFETFERWLYQYVSNWCTCDTLCNHTIGDFIQMYPKYVQRLKAWAQSDNRWVKRGAAVTLIIPARKGLFLDDIFEIADILLTDEDDLVRKGYGWMLKAASEAYEQKVFEYILAHKVDMPRISLRYAIEKMPPDKRTEAMEK